MLDLHDNKLEIIEPDALYMYWLTAVSKIILRNNSIKNTDTYLSSSMKLLFELDLSINFITYIITNMFNGLSRLRTLYLHYNLNILLDGFSFTE